MRPFVCPQGLLRRRDAVICLVVLGYSRRLATMRFGGEGWTVEPRGKTRDLELARRVGAAVGPRIWRAAVFAAIDA